MNPAIKTHRVRMNLDIANIDKPTSILESLQRRIYPLEKKTLKPLLIGDSLCGHRHYAEPRDENKVFFQTQRLNGRSHLGSQELVLLTGRRP